MPGSTTSVKLDDETKERIRRLAVARRRSTHWIMREAIGQYVAREEEREALNRETLAAWEEYQATGLHLTDEEVDGWLAKIESGADVPPPECHD